jgi:hypothetical protein
MVNERVKRNLPCDAAHDIKTRGQAQALGTPQFALFDENFATTTHGYHNAARDLLSMTLPE